MYCIVFQNNWQALFCLNIQKEKKVLVKLLLVIISFLIKYEFLECCNFLWCFFITYQKNGTNCAIVKGSGTIALNVR